MKIIVFGGDGFIGSYLVEQVLNLGHEVTVFDRFYHNKSNNLEHVKNKVRFFSGEFANRSDVNASLNSQDLVYHLISATNAVTSWKDPKIEIEKNIKYSVQLFELAVRNNVKKIVFASSGGTVYGVQNGILSENTLPKPFSPYGIGKLSIEHFLNYFNVRYGVSSDIYRIGNAYGPRQSLQTPQGVMAIWMQKILKGEKIQVCGAYDTYRDYIYANDVAILMTNSVRGVDKSDIYNLGTGRGISIVELLNVFISTIKENIDYEILPRRISDNFSVILNSSKITSYFPGFSFQRLEDKILETWDYVKLHQCHFVML